MQSDLRAENNELKRWLAEMSADYDRIVQLETLFAEECHLAVLLKRALDWLVASAETHPADRPGWDEHVVPALHAWTKLHDDWF